MSAATGSAEAPQDADWSARANCADRRNEFFPPDGSHADPARTRSICDACEVKAECLADVMRLEGNTSPGTRYGMYAALTGRERHKLYQRDPGRWT